MVSRPIVAVVIFNFLVHGFHTGWDAPLSGQPYLAFVIANLIGMAVSYRGSRTWVFKDRPPRTADGGRLMFVRDQPRHDADPDRLPVDQPQRARASTTRTPTTWPPT